MTQCPCYKCEERMLYCHSSCQKYLDFKNECKEINKVRYQDNLYRSYKNGMFDTYCNNYNYKNTKKYKR